MDKQKLLDIVSSDSYNDDEKVTAFIALSNLYNEKSNISEAMKYAALATVSTNTPRADACCCIGDIYLQLNNAEWAIKWYENAISNISSTQCDMKFWTWIPLLKIAQAYTLLFNIEKAKQYLSSAEILSTYQNISDVDELKNAINILETEISKEKN